MSNQNRAFHTHLKGAQHEISQACRTRRANIHHRAPPVCTRHTRELPAKQTQRRRNPLGSGHEANGHGSNARIDAHLHSVHPSFHCLWQSQDALKAHEHQRDHPPNRASPDEHRHAVAIAQNVHQGLWDLGKRKRIRKGCLLPIYWLRVYRHLMFARSMSDRRQAKAAQRGQKHALSSTHLP